MHTLEDSGVGERCFRGTLGGLGLVGRDFRYLSREREREELLPLLLLLSLLDDLERDLLFALAAVPLASFSFAEEGGDFFLRGFAEAGEDFFADLDLESTVFLFLALPLLEAELLREELPDELDRLEPEELERDPELERLELLLPEDELRKERRKKKKTGVKFQLMRTSNSSCIPSSPPSPGPIRVSAVSISLPSASRGRATSVLVASSVPAPAPTLAPISDPPKKTRISHILTFPQSKGRAEDCIGMYRKDDLHV